MTTKNYTIDFINNTITLNKKFAKEASRDINSEAYKTIRNGQVVIVREGKMYNVMGYRLSE